MILRVTQYGEPILREKGKRVETFDASLKQLSADMVETMKAEDGSGIAAQQVGHALQLFIVDISWHPEIDQMHYLIDGKRPPLELLMPMTMVNTTLEMLPQPTVCADEGCLSFPGVRGEVTRPDAIRGTYQDLDGNLHTYEATDWFARVIQHEFDHTQGVLFIDRMPARALRQIEAKVKRIKRRSRDFLKSDPQ